MGTRLQLREHEGAELSIENGTLVVDAVSKLASVLRPQWPQVSRNGRVVEVKNLIGSVRLDDGTVLEVQPKVPVGSDWPNAVVQLLDENSRISVTGSQRSRLGDSRQDLTAVIAFEFARRLERALARDGPLQVFERIKFQSRRLNGQLDASQYARNAWRDPILFPVARDELTAANDFARGLSVVAHGFRRSVDDPVLSAKLRRLETAILPGLPSPSHIDPAVATRRLPAQWANYRPAWDIAAAVLRNRSVVNDPGHLTGLEVAVEPWPLLETLLERTLKAVEKTCTTLRYRPKKKYPLLAMGNTDIGFVTPDGVLEYTDGTVAATFEAKYTRSSAHPAENHRYQALATAAALRSPLSLLVYPGSTEPRVYDVYGFSGYPMKLATIGLNLYDYKRDNGADSRAAAINQLLTTAAAIPMSNP